jgi:predicted aspartyl protease
LLDTGADVTLLPQAFVEQLGISVDATEGYELKGFDGNVSIARVVEVDVLFLRRAFKGRFLLIEQEWGLIGRDVLNHLSLLFDGLRLEWSEQK